MSMLQKISAVSFSLLLILCGLLLPQATSAQSATDGAIGGIVTDSSGAVVPNANIRATNLGTNNSSNSVSNEGGRFSITHLAPGVYSVEITATGLASFKATSITVEVGRLTNLDANLGVQSQTETVVATAEAPVVTTDRADFSTNFNVANVENLPLNGRRWSTLALSTPGAVADGTFGLVSFRGISGLLNNNTVDGGDNNQAFFAEEKGRTRINYSVSQASIQEFQVNSSNFSAEYGRSAGGVVNAITRSGSNQFHGQAFWFYRDSDFGAFNPFAFITTLQGGVPVTSPVNPEDKRHQFGGNIGGPIWKDKLFFFFNADQQKRNFPGVANASNPTAFFSPLSTTCSPAPCLSEIDQLAARGITTDQANAGLAFLQSLTGVVPRTGDELVLFPKIDWIINSNNKFSAQYNRMRWSSPAGVQTAGVVFRGVDSFGNDFVKDDTLIARLTSTVSPTMINEFRFQYGRDFEYQDTQPSIPGEPVSAQGISPQITINGSAGIAFGKPNFLNRRSYPDEHSLQFADTYSINKSAHMLKFGFDIVRFNDVNDNLFQESGAYTYNNRVDYISDYVAAVDDLGPVCGTATKVGCYTSYNQGFGPTKFELSTVDFGFFIQDDWRISPRLTLNLGLRWDYERLPDPQIPNPNLPLTAKFPDDKNNFGPRIGFAWDIDGRGKTVLRGGYGTYYGRIINSTISNAITNVGSPAGQFQFTYRPTDASPLPEPPQYPNVAAGPGNAPLNVGDVIQFAADTQAPMIHQFDLVFEKEIAANTAVSVSWVGSIGRYLPVFLDTNLNPPTSTITYAVQGGPLDGQSLTVPLFTGPRPIVGAVDPTQTYGRVTDISDSVTSHYNAFNVQFNRRLTHGFQIQTFYTYSNTSDDGQSSQTFTSANNVLNPFDLNGEEGRSNFDIRHHFGATALWQPAFFHQRETIVRTLLDGWSVAPIVSVTSGVPFTATVSGNAFGGTSLGIIGAGGSSRLPNLPRNSFQMPRLVNVDMRLAKKFVIRESLGLELFGEAFNLFNHVNVTAVGTRIYSIGGNAGAPTLVYDPSFGVPTQSTTSTGTQTQRAIQIGAKFTW